MFAFPRQHSSAMNKYGQILNEYTKLDPTLPRVTNIVCPNAECPSNKGEATREVIYVRYDETNIDMFIFVLHVIKYGRQKTKIKIESFKKNNYIY